MAEQEFREETPEEILKRVYERALRNPFPMYNHIQIGVVEQDHVEVFVDLCDESMNVKGTVHGGLLFTMADFCGATCARTDGREYSTMSAEVHYLKTAVSGRITARSSVIHRGRTTVLVGTDIYDEQERLLFKATLTMFCIGDRPTVNV